MLQLHRMVMKSLSDSLHDLLIITTLAIKQAFANQSCQNFSVIVIFFYNVIYISTLIVAILAILVIITSVASLNSNSGSGCVLKLLFSPLCLVCVRALHWPHVRLAKFCLRGYVRWFFSGFPHFRPPTDWPFSYELKYS